MYKDTSIFLFVHARVTSTSARSFLGPPPTASTTGGMASGSFCLSFDFCGRRRKRFWRLMCSGTYASCFKKVAKRCEDGSGCDCS